MGDDALDLCEMSVKVAERLGATEAEAVARRGRQISVEVERSAIKSSSGGDALQLSVRAYVGKAMGLAFTTAGEGGEVERLAKLAEVRFRDKMFGGGMRQAGVIAAAGIVALETMVDRLADDHANAKRLAEGLADIPGIELDPERIRTNIVFFDLTGALTAPQLTERLAREGVLIGAAGQRRMRAVTHYGIERADIETALGVISRAMK